jgi:hypothetical protein
MRCCCRHLGWVGVWLLLLGAAAPWGAATPITLNLRADRRQIAEGTSVVLHVKTFRAPGVPAVGVKLWPLWNGRRWGAEITTDALGQATYSIPLPLPGLARLQVAQASSSQPLSAWWIWASTLQDHQTVWLWRVFTLPQKPKEAILHITCDDRFTAYLNGKRVATGSDFHKVHAVGSLQRYLHPGTNCLAVECYNGSGPAGLLARLDMGLSSGKSASIVTDSAWQASLTRPAQWPQPTASATPAVVVAKVGEGVWARDITGWPGLKAFSAFTTDTPCPANTPRSNIVLVKVTPWHPQQKLPCDPAHLVGIEWEPWFTPLNATWNTAEAIPVEGTYSSFNPLVARQHLLWMIRCGIDFILVDWSNNLWGIQHWKDHAPGVDELIRGTDVLFQQAAKLQQEGFSVPKITLLLGLNNGPSTTTTALNEEIAWVYRHYLANPTYRDLWLDAYGKPLIVLFNGPGPGDLQGQPPILAPQFTVRWMASQLQSCHFERFGYWSWMDGSITPVPTYYQGQPEALTITIAFFGDGGWLYPQAMGHENGYTYLKEWQTAFAVRPRFLLICQWNEFAGQPEGAGYGPKHDMYVDSYSPELSNDIEPTSLTTPAYRGKGGWGYLYLNLTQAAIFLYHHPTQQQGLLALAPPKKEQGALVFRWAYLGYAPTTFTVMLDGKPVATHLHGDAYRPALESLSPGKHRIEVQAENVYTLFPISQMHEDRTGEVTQHFPVKAEEEFVR